jgi:glutamyl-tRNA reductase
MGEGIAVALHAAGVGDVTVVNRSEERGRALAERINGISLGFERLHEVLGSAELVLTSTGADRHLITTDVLGPLSHADRPMLIVDIAVPRDVAPDVADLDGVTVFDLEDLTAWADRGRQQRLAEVERVELLVGEALDRFTVESTSLQAAPLIAALRRRADELRRLELERHGHGRLDPEMQELLDAVTRGLVAKLLHEPSVRLRQQAGSPQGERNAAAIADLFDLG